MEKIPNFSHDGYACRAVLTSDGPAALKAEIVFLRLCRPMIVGSPRALASAPGRAVVAVLPGVVSFDEIVEHPRLAAVERGAEIAQARGVDGLVSFGGGSAGDLAKGIALRLAAGEPLERFAANTHLGHAPAEFPRGLRPMPIIAMPNSASGAEVTPSIGLCDDSRQKLMIRHPACVARVVILDPEANLDTPARILLPTGINAVAHCLEALYSTRREPASDALALEGLRLLHHGLSGMLRADGPDVRRAILAGAFLAGGSIVNARTGIHHATCHVIGAQGVSHGIANSILLPHALRFNAEAAGSLLDRAADAIGRPGPGAAERLVQAVDALCAGLPRRLRDVGIAEGAIPAMADAVMEEPGLRFNPRQPVSPADVEALLRAAW